MAKLIYTCATDIIHENRIGNDFELELPSGLVEFDPVGIDPVSEMVWTADCSIFQRTTISTHRTLSFTLEAVEENDLQYWREMWDSQVYTSNSMTIDATDIPGVSEVMQIALDVEPWRAPRFSCYRYTQSYNAFVID